MFHWLLCVLCLHEIHIFQAVVPATDSQRSKSDSDSTSTGSFDITTGSHGYSPSPDSGCHSDWNFRQRSITPVEYVGAIDKITELKKTDSSGNFAEVRNTENDTLEVIRLPKHGVTHKHKKRKKKRQILSSLVSDAEVTDKIAQKDKQAMEIPRVDEVIFEDAVINNNMESNVPGLLPSYRLPGDGHENGDSTLSQNKSKQANDQGTGLYNEKEMSECNDKLNESFSRINTNNKSYDILKSDQSLDITCRDNVKFQEALRNSTLSEKNDSAKNNKFCDNLSNFTEATVSMTNDVQYVDSQGNNVNDKHTSEVQYEKCNETDLCSSSQVTFDDEHVVAEPHPHSPVHHKKGNDSCFNLDRKLNENDQNVFVRPSVYSSQQDSDSSSNESDKFAKCDIIPDYKNASNGKSDEVTGNVSCTVPSDCATLASQAPEIHAERNGFLEKQTMFEDVKCPVVHNTYPDHNTHIHKCISPAASEMLCDKLSGTDRIPSTESRQSPSLKDRLSLSQKSDIEIQWSDKNESSGVELQGKNIYKITDILLLCQLKCQIGVWEPQLQQFRPLF